MRQKYAVILNIPNFYYNFCKNNDILPDSMHFLA